MLDGDKGGGRIRTPWYGQMNSNSPGTKERIPVIADHARHPGDAEAAAAIAAMKETYPSGYRPSPGDVVIGEPPFVGYRRAGIVRATNGESCLVEMDGEMLMYYPRELEFTGKRIGG